MRPCPLPDDNATRTTSPYFLAHAHERVYTRRFTVCECMRTRWHMLTTQSRDTISLRRASLNPEITPFEIVEYMC